VASDVARAYCIAEHFNGKPIRVSVRFSNGLVGVKQHDGWSDVRGMATRFHISGERGSDLIATTLGEFFVRNVDGILRVPARSRSARSMKRRPCGWRRLGTFCKLKIPPRNPYPNETENVDEGALRYANLKPLRPVGNIPGWPDRRTGELCPRELSCRPHLLGDGSPWGSPPGALFLAAGRGVVRNTNPKAVPHEKISVRRA